MPTVSKFEDLEVWKNSRQLCIDLSNLLKSVELRDYGLKNQMLNSSGSIMDNIAEGFERGTRNEFIKFLTYSKGSAGELRSQLYRLGDLYHCDLDRLNALKEEVTSISKMLNGLMSYLKRSKYDGIRYKED